MIGRPKAKDLRGRRVLITGAASGIGRATAEAAGAEGAELFLTDVQEATLDDVAARLSAGGARVGYHAAADVADYEQVGALAARIHERSGPMHVVMNIAGNSTWGTVEQLEHRQWKAMVDVNLMGPIHVIEHFLPPMIAAGAGGYLVNVSSAAGLVGLPWHAAYSAGKFGIRGVSEVLRFDLRRHGIGVSLVCPGAVDTPLAQTIEISGVDKGSDSFVKWQRRFHGRAVSPEQAARSILDGMKRGRYLVYTSHDIAALHALQKFAPHVYEIGMVGFNRAVSAALGAAAPAPADGSAQ